MTPAPNRQEQPKRERVSGIQQAAVKRDAAALARTESETATISAILQYPDTYVQVSDQLQAADFFQVLMGFAWYAFEQVLAQGGAIDLITVAAAMDKQPRCPLHGKDLETALTALLNKRVLPDNVPQYVREVREAALRLRTLRAAEQILALAFDEPATDAFIDKSNMLLFQATEQTYHVPTDMQSIVGAYREKMQALISGAQQSPLVTTGFRDIDAAIGGFAADEVTCIAGTDKSGKTTLLLSKIRRMLKRGKHVMLFTLEMTQEEIVQALVAMESGIWKSTLKAGKLSPHQTKLFLEATETVAAWPLHIVDEYKALTPMQLQQRVRKHRASEWLDLVAIDGLWLMEPDDEKLAHDRPRAVYYICRDLTAQAKMFHLPYVITHQYSTIAMQQKNIKKPDRTFLAESAGPRRNFQIILGLWRTKGQVGDGSDDKTMLHVLADRNGSAQDAEIELSWDSNHSCYDDRLVFVAPHYSDKDDEIEF